VLLWSAPVLGRWLVWGVWELRLGGVWEFGCRWVLVSGVWELRLGVWVLVSGVWELAWALCIRWVLTISHILVSTHCILDRRHWYSRCRLLSRTHTSRGCIVPCHSQYRYCSCWHSRTWSHNRRGALI